MDRGGFRWHGVRRPIVAVGALALASALAGWQIWRHHDAFGGAVRQLGWWPVAGAFLLDVAATGCLAMVWRSVLAGLGAPLGVRTGLSVFFVSQLGKYLPGAVWPVAAQLDFGRRRGIAGRTVIAANVVFLSLTVAVGLVVAVVLLPLSSPAALGRYWWVLLSLPLLAATLHPRSVPVLVDAIGRRLGGAALTSRLATPRLATPRLATPRLATSAMFSAVAWSLAAWLLLGLQIYLLARALGPGGGSLLASSVGGFALAFCAGLLFLPAPAGAGVREAVLVLTLHSDLGAGPALAVAVVSRVGLIVADVALAMGGGAVGGRFVRGGGHNEPPDPVA